MASYVDTTHVLKCMPHYAFDAVHEPGSIAPYSGIYRCVNCGQEVCCNKDHPFPSQDQHQHATQTPIGWKLLVMCAIE